MIYMNGIEFYTQIFSLNFSWVLPNNSRNYDSFIKSEHALNPTLFACRSL